MTDLWIFPLCLATLMVTFSTFEFFLWSRRPQRKKDFVLAFMFLIMAAYGLVTVQILRVGGMSLTVAWLKANLICDLLLAGLFVWYLAVLTGHVGRLALVVWSSVTGLLAVLCAVLPDPFIATVAPFVVQQTIPLGYRLSYHWVQLGPLVAVVAAAGLPLAAHLAFLLRRHARAGHGREAGWLVAFAALALVAVLNDVLVATGAYRFVFLTPKAWLVCGTILAFGSWKDILDREESVDNLKRTEAQFSTVFENAPLSIWMGDAQGRMIRQNRINVALVGTRLGETTLDGHFPPGTELVWSLNQRALEGGVAEGQVVYQVDGQPRTYRLLIAPVREKDTVVGTFGFGVDITEQVAAEREKDLLHAQLIQSQKMESLGLLAGGIAHDMNNILTAILGVASTRAATLPASDPHAPDFARVKTAAERGAQLLRGLLSFARQGNGEERPVDLNAIVREALLLLRSAAPPSIEFRTALDARLPRVQGDANALSTVLMNLCGNALDAMPAQGILAVSTKHHHGTVEVVVRDTGVGMAPEVLSRAIEPFFTTKPEGAGTGLGLSQAYRIISAHHGTLSLSSQPGQGTSVQIVLPVGPRPPAEPEHRAESPPTRSRRLTVLVVDDDLQILDVVEATLKTLGHVPQFATNGDQALRRLAEQDLPDAVILDYNMPGASGDQILEALSFRGAEQRAVVSTGRMDQAVMATLERYPAARVLPKPYTFEDLRDVLNAIGG